MGWARKNNMQLVSTIEESTHRDGGFLDLTRSNMLATASVSTRFHCTSDRSTIEWSVDTTVNSELSGMSRLIRVKECNQDKFNRCAKHLVKYGPLNSPIEIENRMEMLIQALQDAVKLVG